MKIIMPELKGKADGKVISAAVDKVLKNAENLRQEYEKELEALSQLKKSTLEEYEKAKNQNNRMHC